MVTVVEIAAYLGVSPGYVRQVIAEHGIRGRKVLFQRAWIYPIADIIRHAGNHDRLAYAADLH